MRVHDELSTLEKLRALESAVAVFDESRNVRLTRLGAELGAQLRPPRTYSRVALYRVFAGKPAGRFLATAIDRLYVQRVAE